MLVKNIGSFWFGEQQLVINYATIFVIPTPDVIVVKRLIKIHNKRTKGQIFVPTLCMFKFEILVC
jgi:hypothetical protein